MSSCTHATPCCVVSSCGYMLSVCHALVSICARVCAYECVCVHACTCVCVHTCMIVCGVYVFVVQVATVSEVYTLLSKPTYISYHMSTRTLANLSHVCPNVMN